MLGESKEIIEAVEWTRPQHGPSFQDVSSAHGFQLSGLPGWQSNGGPHRGHRARSFPFTLEGQIPPERGLPTRLHLVGIFALFCNSEIEAPGTLGASVQIEGQGAPMFRLELLNGRHYRDAGKLAPIHDMLGDGTSVETLGHTNIDGERARVDLLSLDLPTMDTPGKVRFKDLGSPASFVIFDILCELRPHLGCPFRAGTSKVSLAEIGGLVRLGDRQRFSAALDQLSSSLEDAEDLDEARSQALTFLALVTAAMLELGGGRELHLEQLRFARELDRLSTPAEVALLVRSRAESVAAPAFREAQGPSIHLVDRAIAIVERQYARPLTDTLVASQLGLSTSHFRFLFKEATGQPFHRYLISVRLEKAKQMLIQQEAPVSVVARTVGFSGLSHFSRAFAQRFSVSPTNIRRQVG